VKFPLTPLKAGNDAMKAVTFSSGDLKAKALLNSFESTSSLPAFDPR